ncbi:hypothetical protein WR25_17120 [Diploscapter pachys]|uniref:non-specific serine/threonine protein kinase n=1 Tax=Diploscapter pachys TaxID=2018661 RepID=A0A2A2LKL6_9BILA|nr:hypothetical protein WR25_17120 [Diploscapter pachys]
MTLRRHKLRNHTARHEWGYRCPYCEEIYMEPASYQQHVQTKHINQSATYGCPHSDCNFTTKCFRHFQEHLMKHINADTTMNGVTKISMSKQNLSRYLIDDEYESLSPPSNPSGSNSHIPESSVNPQFINLRSSHSNPEQSNPQVIRARLVPRHDIKIEPTRGQGSYEYFQSGQDSDKSEENFYDLESYSEAPPILEQEASFTEIIDNCLQTEVKTMDDHGHQNGANGGDVHNALNVHNNHDTNDVNDVHKAPKQLQSSLTGNLRITIDDEAVEPNSELEMETGSESVFERDESENPGEPSQTGPKFDKNNIKVDRKDLKLSVGASDSEEEDMTDEQRMKQLQEWHQQNRVSISNELNDFDMDLDPVVTADRITSILKGDIIFDTMPPENFVEEIYSVKAPKVIRKYLFGDVIGKGSYARVKEVVEVDTLTRRAIKIIKEQRIRKIPNGHENVMREIQILRKVQHLNVIKLIEVFSDPTRGKMYVVMEYCIGSLQQTIDGEAEKRLEESEAHNYFKQLIAGLVYLHSLGIIHKDIKPGNLLLSTDLTLKISDFGVAEELSPFQGNDFCQTVQGTPKFQAPELVSGNSEFYYGHKADVWACGVTLYNMVSGLYPFEGEVIMRLFDNIASAPLEMPQNVKIEKHLEELLRGMMEKDPLKRWSTEKIQHSQWFRHKLARDLTYYKSQACYDADPRRPTTVHPALVELFGPDPAQSDSQGGDNGTLPKSGLSDTSMRGFINDDVVMEDSEAPTSQITPTPRILLPPGVSETTAPIPSSSRQNPTGNGFTGSASQPMESSSVPPSLPPVPRRNRSFLNCFRSSTAP